jgi:prophage tail gpP-like protein
VITRAATGAAVSVVRGGSDGTLLSASASYDYKDRFSHYRVKGQRAGSDEAPPETAAHGLAEALDPGVKRYRPLIVIAEDQGDSGSLTVRANWEATVRCGRSRRATLRVQGWRDAHGQLWAPNRRVRIECDWLRLADEMLVASVRLRQDAGGTVTDLEVADPDAFTPEPKTDKDEPGW